LSRQDDHIWLSTKGIVRSTALEHVQLLHDTLVANGIQSLVGPGPSSLQGEQLQLEFEANVGERYFLLFYKYPHSNGMDISIVKFTPESSEKLKRSFQDSFPELDEQNRSVVF
jgi:hypothetical protein